jgi:hypothetical protein
VVKEDQMVKKQLARSRLIKWDRVFFRVLLVVTLLMTLLLMATVGSFDGPELAGARYLDIRTTTESANIGIEGTQLPGPGSAPVKLCSVNWED